VTPAATGSARQDAARPARRADAGRVRLSGRDVAGLLPCGEHYAAPYDLLASALAVQPARLRGIVARWRAARHRDEPRAGASGGTSGSRMNQTTAPGPGSRRGRGSSVHPATDGQAAPSRPAPGHQHNPLTPRYRPATQGVADGDGMNPRGWQPRTNRTAATPGNSEAKRREMTMKIPRRREKVRDGKSGIWL
jgi:hypothetical protein